MRIKVMRFNIIMLIMLLTTACSRVRLEDRNYVMALGIDCSNDGLEVSLSFPDLKALTGKGDNIHYPVMHLRGRNMEEIELLYEHQASRYLDYGHLQVIVFGKEIFMNRAKMHEILDYMKNKKSIARTVYVCAAKNEAKSIILLDKKVKGSIGLYIHDMFENHCDISPGCQSVLNDLMVADCNENMPVSVVELSEHEKEFPEITATLLWPVSDRHQREISGALLRLHVRADDDSDQAQRVKISVKDAMVETMAMYEHEMKDKATAIKAVRSHQSEFYEAAKKVLKRKNCLYGVDINIENTWFPEKTYGDVTLPEGMYDAVVVKLGRGRGENWWCVLFPKLCFVTPCEGVLPEASKTELKELLSKDAYESIMTQPRFKIVEWLDEIW